MPGDRRTEWGRGALALLVGAVLILGSVSAHAERLSAYLDKISITDFFPGADHVGAIRTDFPVAPVFQGERQLGYLFLNSDWANSIGYSGKPIDIVLGITDDGVLAGGRMVAHKEPIILVGIPESKITHYIDGYKGFDVAGYAKSDTQDVLPSDIVSGATVTIMVIDDSMRRSAIKVARALQLGGLRVSGAIADQYVVDTAKSSIVDWQTLVGDGSVRRLDVTRDDINQAFSGNGDPRAASKVLPPPGDTTFIDLYAALVSIPTIGRSLLGDAEYANLQKMLQPDQQAILIAANGEYSFKGSGYVRGGVFDRIQVTQGDSSIRFRDRHHKRLGDIAAAGAPRFSEVSLFVVPRDIKLDPAAPWHFQLLVQRRLGALDKIFTTVGLDYTPPVKYLRKLPTPEPVPGASAAPATGGNAAMADDDSGRDALWMRVWKSRMVDIAVLATAMLLLTGLFFFQDWFVRRRKLTERIRIGFLLFTVVWIGYYAHAQLSVVNVLTVATSFGSGFDWGYFLMDPLIFILWFAVAAAMIFWGRGAYCGWLCPFGALQELLNKLAKAVRIPQLTIPFAVHQRLWPLKYIGFLVLFGVAFHDFDQAERIAEIEPFKTAIILGFVREWPFVLYAFVLLGIGLFVERFFCRYLCPLGAALAIPGRMRINDWLKRYRDCGSPCQRCSVECMVQAIHPDGHIDPNECLYCLHCQELYYDAHDCPVVIKKMARLERRLALQTNSPSSLTHKNPAVENVDGAGGTETGSDPVPGRGTLYKHHQEF
ncbi:NosR/NirI family protein [Thalassospira mesophila]|uniref:NosR/NirI family protein n=1 Tax=Thalassospira mesophila TaxID=1293891 RepID=UPI00117D6F25|nr:NosR/NirI family protein [Thalassospira mesophila]